MRMVQALSMVNIDANAIEHKSDNKNAYFVGLIERLNCGRIFRLDRCSWKGRKRFASGLFFVSSDH